MNLILLGAPGAGKGTYSELLTQRCSIPAISTGTMHRDIVKNGMNPCRNVKIYCDNGFQLDGVLCTPVHTEQSATVYSVISNDPPTNKGICSQSMADAGWDTFKAMGAVV